VQENFSVFDSLLNVEIVVCGDLNCPNAECEIDDHLGGVTRDYNLVQHAVAPPHVDGNQLDLVLMHDDGIVITDVRVTDKGIVYHYLI